MTNATKIDSFFNLANDTFTPVEIKKLLFVAANATEYDNLRQVEAMKVRLHEVNPKDFEAFVGVFTQTEYGYSFGDGDFVSFEENEQLGVAMMAEMANCYKDESLENVEFPYGSITMYNAIGVDNDLVEVSHMKTKMDELHVNRVNVSNSVASKMFGLPQFQNIDKNFWTASKDDIKGGVRLNGLVYNKSKLIKEIMTLVRTTDVAVVVKRLKSLSKQGKVVITKTGNFILDNQAAKINTVNRQKSDAEEAWLKEMEVYEVKGIEPSGIPWLDFCMEENLQTDFDTINKNQRAVYEKWLKEKIGNELPPDFDVSVYKTKFVYDDDIDVLENLQNELKMFKQDYEVLFKDLTVVQVEAVDKLKIDKISTLHNYLYNVYKKKKNIVNNVDPVPGVKKIDKVDDIPVDTKNWSVYNNVHETLYSYTLEIKGKKYELPYARGKYASVRYVSHFLHNNNIDDTIKNIKNDKNALKVEQILTSVYNTAKGPKILSALTKNLKSLISYLDRPIPFFVVVYEIVNAVFANNDFQINDFFLGNKKQSEFSSLDFMVAYFLIQLKEIKKMQKKEGVNDDYFDRKYTFEAGVVKSPYVDYGEGNKKTKTSNNIGGAGNKNEDVDSGY